MPCSDCSPTLTALTKLKECKLLERLRTNHAPIASERVELKELVSHAERELMQYEETIARLHETIINLSNERNKLSRQVCLAQSLMTPIRSLPPEILREIFLANRAKNEIRPKLGCVVPGFAVTSVCFHWRSVATNTLALWNVISLSADSKSHWPTGCVSLTEKLLALSASSYLHIHLDFRSNGDTVPSSLLLLCEQARRWQTLSGSCYTAANIILETLFSIRERFASLQTCQLDCEFSLSSRLIEAAPKLRTLVLNEIDAENSTIPWNQIVNLDICVPSFSNIIRSLSKLSNLLTLELRYPYLGQPEAVGLPLIHSKLTSLTIYMELAGGDDERTTESLLGNLTLPKLESLCIVTVHPGTSYFESNQFWPSRELPSFLSRSSAVITSFMLDGTWMCPGDLIALLKSMPALTVLSISDPYPDNVMITDEFLSSLSVHSCRQDRQPLLTRLQSLTLKIKCKLSLFNVHLFEEVVHSRWKPLYARIVDDSPDEVACIRVVKLVIINDRIKSGMLHSLMMLRGRGLNISVKDVDDAMDEF